MCMYVNGYTHQYLLDVLHSSLSFLATFSWTYTVDVIQYMHYVLNHERSFSEIYKCGSLDGMILHNRLEMHLLVC